jgi:hypothetical protein
MNLSYETCPEMLLALKPPAIPDMTKQADRHQSGRPGTVLRAEWRIQQGGCADTHVGHGRNRPGISSRDAGKGFRERSYDVAADDRGFLLAPEQQAVTKREDSRY